MIMKRSTDTNNNNRNLSASPDPNAAKKSAEQREQEYAAARAAIFGDAVPGGGGGAGPEPAKKNSKGGKNGGNKKKMPNVLADLADNQRGGYARGNGGGNHPQQSEEFHEYSRDYQRNNYGRRDNHSPQIMQRPAQQQYFHGDGYADNRGFNPNSQPFHPQHTQQQRQYGQNQDSSRYGHSHDPYSRPPYPRPGDQGYAQHDPYLHPQHFHGDPYLHNYPQQQQQGDPYMHHHQYPMQQHPPPHQPTRVLDHRYTSDPSEYSRGGANVGAGGVRGGANFGHGGGGPQQQGLQTNNYQDDFPALGN